jgi:hypothetical protein
MPATPRQRISHDRRAELQRGTEHSIRRAALNPGDDEHPSPEDL